MKPLHILLAGMIALFVLAWGYILIFVLYQKRMIAKDLQQQKLENNYQKKLLRSAIDSQETERKRIAHDLHDEIGALLTTSRLYVNQLGPGRSEEQMKAVSDKINLLFNEMMSNIRRISHDLRPVVLENLGLTEAIENMRIGVQASGIDFNFTHQITCTLSHEAELMVYRIIQELISNTLKHARASRIDLHIEEQGGRLHLSYADNGTGFDASKKSAGLGLKSIETRLSLVEASMHKVYAAQGVCFLIDILITKLTDYERH